MHSLVENKNRQQQSFETFDRQREMNTKMTQFCNCLLIQLYHFNLIIKQNGLHKTKQKKNMGKRGSEHATIIFACQLQSTERKSNQWNYFSY